MPDDLPHSPDIKAIYSAFVRTYGPVPDDVRDEVHREWEIAYEQMKAALGWTPRDFSGAVDAGDRNEASLVVDFSAGTHGWIPSTPADDAMADARGPLGDAGRAHFDPMLADDAGTVSTWSFLVKFIDFTDDHLLVRATDDEAAQLELDLQRALYVTSARRQVIPGSTEGIPLSEARAFFRLPARALVVRSADLRSLDSRLGLSLESLARVLGVSTSRVQGWEAAESFTVDGDTARRLAASREILALADEVYGDGVETFLATPRRSLGMRTPRVAMADGDLETVRQVGTRRACRRRRLAARQSG